MAASSAATLSLPPSVPGTALTEAVLARYDCWNSEEVRAFLRHHADICQVLLHAVAPLETVFGKGTTIALQVLDDHDGDNDVVLKAWIQTGESVEAALEKRRQFGRQWWSTARPAARGALRFDVDCL